MNKDIARSAATNRPVVAEFPLSAAQLRCWFLETAGTANSSLNVAVRWKLSGDFQVANVESAFQAVIDRHEILRTRFVAPDGNPVQQVVDFVEFKLDLVDIRTIAEDKQAARIEAIAHEVAARPFDLSEPGLIRATLIQLASDRAMLIIVVHQSCFDGFSIRVLGHEIGSATQAFEEGLVPDLPELALQYGDFALWQQEYFTSGAIDEESAYWVDTLKDAPFFEVEPDRSRPLVLQTDAAQTNLDLSANFAARLAKTAQDMGVSTFTLGSAVFSACLHRLSGAEDILFGTQIAGRTDADLDPLIGVFINNLVLRFKTTPQTLLSEHVASAKPVVEGALVHQAMPFNALVERLNPVRDPSRLPLLSVNFNLQHVFMESRSYGGLELASSPSHAAGTIYDLDLAVMGRPTGWQLNLEYATALFDTATAQGILTLVANAFELFFSNPNARLSDIELPESLAERGQDDRKCLSDVEYLLGAHPMVKEAAVIRTTDAVYGFVVPGETGFSPLEHLPQTIIDDLASNPVAQSLAGISIVADFPRTAAGSINKSLLKVPRKIADNVRNSPALVNIIEALRSDWQELLGCDVTTSTKSFFDLGGHSVLVLRLLTRIRQQWGLSLNVTQLYENATLAELARLVDSRLRAGQAAEQDEWRFMRLRREGEGLPLVAVNNAATGLALSTLGSHPRQVSCARIFDGDRGISLEDQPFEDIAAQYADVIRQAQPDGPYLLYGNCVHGNLALEAARILHRNGATIAGVVMKDVWEPTYTNVMWQNPKTRMREKRHALRTRLRAWRDGEITTAALLGSYRIFRRSGVLQLATWLGLIDRVRRSDLDTDQELFVSFVSRMRDAYRPGPVNFPVLHVVTDISPQGPGFRPSIGWEDVVAPEMLKTVHINKVLVLREKRVGVEAMAQEIEQFLEER